jgi:hypothetical protein
MTLTQPVPTNPHKDSVVLRSGGEDMLKIAPDGFYVRGVKVPVDDNEALAVYNSFNQWLAWAQLQRQHD